MAKIYRHKFGTPEYPIPVLDKITNQITWLADEENAIYIPTMRNEDKDRIYGRLIRQVVTDPSMMKDMTEMLLRLDKSRTPAESKSYGYTTMGAPGNGKTFLAKSIGELVHPKGALIVDCNNIDNPDELFKVTTFSVDQTRKQRKLDARIRIGNQDPEFALSQNAVAYLKKMFGNDIVTQETREDRKITAIDWNAINQDASYMETVLDKVMEMEGITYEKDASSLGFVVSNGPLLQALINPDSPDYGRMVIRDEANRGPAVDAWLRIQAFFSEPTAEELKLKGEDDKEMVIRRSEIPDTFMFLGTANNATEDMGISAKELTKPMISREGMGIDIRQISDPETADFVSRSLKHLTGVPAYHVYMMDNEYYDLHPEELAETLMHLRTVGLTAEEKKKIPQEEKFNITHIDRTIEVALQFGSLIASAETLVQQAIKDDSLPVAYTDYLKNQVVLDLRYVYKLYQHSKINTPQSKVRGRKAFAGLGKKERQQSQEEIAWEMSKRIANREKEQLLVRGTRLENEVATKLHDMIMPDSLNNMLKDSDAPEEDYAKIETVWASLKKIAQGLHFRFAGYVGEDSVADLYNAHPEDLPSVAIEEIKNVLVSSVNYEYGEQLQAEDVVDDDTLLEAVAMLGTEDNLQHIFIPNYNIETTAEKPILKTYMSSTPKEIVTREELITATQFADSFILKNMRKYNIRKYAMEKPNLSPADGNEISRRIAEGKDDNFFTTNVLVNDKENADIGFASIIYNKGTQNAMILATFDISATQRAQLTQNGVLFVNVRREKAEAEEARDYKMIADYLQKQTDLYVESSITPAHIVSSMMLRIEKDLAEGGTVEDFYQFLQALPSSELAKTDAVQLTNVEYEDNKSLQQVLIQKRKGR
ncbi:MAG: hypothetical protein NC218_10730 [Acetobacter sp.]|nr:hypothetical protein [Acetobacter sp.]